MMDMDFVNDPIDTGLIFDPNGFHGLAIGDWLSNLGTSFTDWVDSWSSHSGFSNDVIVGSVHDASNFFHIDDPMQIREGWTTGVYPNNPFTDADDVLMVNRDQLLDMGLTEKDGLDLVMTHECAHRALQNRFDLGFNSHQEELCCDFMAGVRAGLNGIDVTQMKESLADSMASETHPAGELRVDAIDAGVEFAQSYLEDHGVPPTFEECVECITDQTSDICALVNDDAVSQITLREDVDAPSELKGYTQSEINSHIHDAERDMDYYKAQMRRHGELMKNSAYPETEEMHLKDAERKYNAAKAEYNKWSNMTPNEGLKGFVNDKEWQLEEARKAAERGDLSKAKDRLKSAEMCSE